MTPAHCAGVFFIQNRVRQVCRARFQRPQQNRAVAAFGQAATGECATALPNSRFEL
jgi:hypothetical protein